jgi:transposase InsO family protein
MPMFSDLIERHELLELNLFEDIEHAQLLATQLQRTYNNIRPHSAIGEVPLRQLLQPRCSLLLTDFKNGGDYPSSSGS